MVCTARSSGGKGGRNALETLLGDLGIAQKHSAPNHPTTGAKVEREVPANPQEMAHRPNPRRHHRPAPKAPRRLHRHLQPPKAPPQPQPPNTRRRLQPPPQNRTSPKRSRNPLARPPRPRRQNRCRHPATQRQTPPHRHRPTTRRNPQHPPHRRPPHPHRQHPNRRTPTPPHPQPRTRLPTTKQTLKTPHRADSQGSYVLTHHSGWRGRTRTCNLLVQSQAFCHLNYSPRGALVFISGTTSRLSHCRSVNSRVIAGGAAGLAWSHHGIVDQEAPQADAQEEAQEDVEAHSFPTASPREVAPFLPSLSSSGVEQAQCEPRYDHRRGRHLPQTR